jgi:photosynthetic reaction center cytochrome c subunit
MNWKSKGVITALTVLTVSFMTVRMGAQSGGAGAAPSAHQAAAGQSNEGPHGAPPQTAGQHGKNIQVLKDIPADQLIPSMQFIAASLGVDCDFCHVQGDFAKDDKQPKKTAREMITMMFAINKDNFGGHLEVTCYTCHRGSNDPVGTPVISEEEPKPEAMESGGKPSAMPGADQILDKYLQAVGGADALAKVSSRVEKGTLNFSGHESSAEIYAKAPDKRIAVIHMPEGESTTAYDGHVGWLANRGRPPREMTGSDLDAMKLDADFYYLATDAKRMFQRLRVDEHPEKVGDHEAYVIFAITPGHPPVRLFFDKQSGLLLREIRYTQTPLGRLPDQIDYADYREANGVKVPFRWTIARPGGRFTIQVTDLQQNVPIDDSKFAEPKAEAPPAKPSSP